MSKISSHRPSKWKTVLAWQISIAAIKAIRFSSAGLEMKLGILAVMGNTCVLHTCRRNAKQKNLISHTNCTLSSTYGTHQRWKLWYRSFPTRMIEWNKKGRDHKCPCILEEPCKQKLSSFGMYCKWTQLDSETF